MSEKQKKKRASLKKRLARAALSALAGLAALAVMLACGFLMYYISAELVTLPARTRALTNLACAAAIASAGLLAAYYIKSLFADGGED